MKFEKNARYIYTGPQSETGLCLTCGNFEKYIITPTSYEYELSISLMGDIYLGYHLNLAQQPNNFHLCKYETTNSTSLKNIYNSILVNGSSGLGFSMAQYDNDYGEMDAVNFNQLKTVCTLGEITKYNDLFSTASTKGLKSYEWEKLKHEGGLDVYKTKSKLFTLRNITDGGIENNMISATFKYVKNGYGDPNDLEFIPTIVLYLIMPPQQYSSPGPFDKARLAVDYGYTPSVFKCVLSAIDGMESNALKMYYTDLIHDNGNVNSTDFSYSFNSTVSTTDSGVRKIKRNYFINNALFMCDQNL